MKVRSKRRRDHDRACSFPPATMDSTDLEHLNALLDNEIDLKRCRRNTLFEYVFSLKIQKIKDLVSDFDKRTRRVQGALNKIHSTPSEDGTLVYISCYSLPIECIIATQYPNSRPP